MIQNIPKIDIHKKQEWSLHQDNIIKDFPESEFSNFKLKWLEIIQRIDNVNELIHQLFIDFQILNMQIKESVIEDEIFKTPLYYKQKFLTEQIFYWIRKTVDEIISIIYVLEYLKTNSQYPKIIKIDCIGKLINSKEFILNIKEKHIATFNIINDISNTYKHSFMNSEIHAYIGEKDPLIFSYGFKNNNLEKNPIFTQYKMEDIITDLNSLINDFIIYIKEKT